MSRCNTTAKRMLGTHASKEKPANSIAHASISISMTNGTMASFVSKTLRASHLNAGSAARSALARRLKPSLARAAPTASASLR